MRILRAPCLARVCCDAWIICHITCCLLCCVHKNLRMVLGTPRLVDLEINFSSNPYRDLSLNQHDGAHIFIGLSSTPRTRIHDSIFSCIATLNFWTQWNLLTLIRTPAEIVALQANLKACRLPRESDFQTSAGKASSSAPNCCSRRHISRQSVLGFSVASTFQKTFG